MTEQITEQQDTREQQIEALARLACEVENGGDDTAWDDEEPIGWPNGDSARAWYRDRAKYLLDDPLVARMIADAEQAAERRGAVASEQELHALPIKSVVMWSEGGVARRMRTTENEDGSGDSVTLWLTPGGSRLDSHTLWTYTTEHRSDTLRLIYRGDL